MKSYCCRCARTVDGNGNALVENIAVSADEGWDLAELVQLQVLRRDTFSWLGLNNIEFDVIGLCNSTNGGGAGVTLKEQC